MTPQQQRLAALYEVSSRLSTTLDLSELLNMVMDATLQLTEGERGFLVLVDEVTGRLQTAVARNVDQESIGDEGADISRSVVTRVIDSGEPVLTDNAQEDERFADRQSVVNYQLRSIMCAPLRARGRVIGAAYVDNRLFSNAFSEDDLELLVAFASQAAMAIENARLFQQTDQALRRRVEELTLFQRIDQELNKSLDLHRVLNLALEWAMQLTGADAGSIGLMEEVVEDANGHEPAVDGSGQRRLLRLLAYQGDNEGDGERVVPAEHPVLAQVLARGTSVETQQASAAEAIDGTAAAAQLAVPVKREGEIIGLIALESRSLDRFRGEDAAFVERLADRAAVAIENARLYKAVRAADRAKSEFISLVTHELRIPMTSIRGYTDLLLKELAGPLNDSQQQFLDTIKRNLNRMSVLVSDLSDINRIESGRMKFELAAFDLRDVVHDVAGDLREAIEQRDQTLALALPDEMPPVYADRTRAAQIVTNLVSNAYKYTPDGGHISVSVRAIDGSPDCPPMAQVDVVDNGIGISEEDQARLFSQFFRADNDAVRQQVGWGLGLSIVKKLVEAQGGAITFESEEGAGSTFSFTLPLAGEGGDD
ncbi:MAG TPA: GAF domain-containing sensor histidine kinase [Candidatus Sulfomarinibacteraceae bacterium]|nr:GAF domain-containing sensor histidine kinase [Candidatus Sulfomarinibacteraceae bacterium]